MASSTKATFVSSLVIQDGDHPDYALIKRIEEAILEAVGGEAKFRVELPKLIRQAIDEVIDPARSRRFTLDEIEKTEKTYLGTKMEILLRNYFGFAKGKVLDLNVDGVEVDIKNTIKDSWMIPREAMDQVCILVKEDESKVRFSFGIVVIRKDRMRDGHNRDQKGSLSSKGSIHVHWMFKDAAYPASFWSQLSPEVRLAITAPRGGTQRLIQLFRLVQNKPIPRNFVSAIAPQYDPMKRVRKNGGARDLLEEEGIAILWGGKHGDLINQFGLPPCSRAEFISYRPTTAEQIEMLRRAGRLK